MSFWNVCPKMAHNGRLLYAVQKIELLNLKTYTDVQ